MARRPLARPSPHPGVVVATLAAWLWAAAPATAVERIELTLGSLAGSQWRVDDARLALTLGPDGPLSLDLQAARIHLPGPVQVLQQARLQCHELVLSGSVWNCRRGSLQAQHPQLPADPMPAAARYDSATGHLEVELEDAALLDGRADLRLTGGTGPWRLSVEARDVPLAAVVPWLPPHLLGGYTVDGALSGSFSLVFDESGLRTVAGRPELTEGAFSGPAGVNAAEDISLRGDFQVTRVGRGWRSDGRLSASGGTLCLGPCWELPVIPLELAWQAAWHAGRVHLERITAVDGAGSRLEGSLTVAPAQPRPLRAADVAITTAAAGDLYRRYLQPLLIGSLAGNLEVAGRFDGELRYGQAGLQLRAELDDLALRDRDGRFALWGLGGALRWHGDAPARSRLRWDGGRLYELPLGASTVEFEAGAETVRLTAPVSLPVFDGSLEVASFALSDPGGDDMAWQLDAVLTPLSMEDFSAALGWPVMTGRLSGVVPDLRYADGTIEVGGVLLVRAFDGDITVRDLRIERLLGVVPTLTADIALRNVDLHELTGTFSFGRIEGRLEGRIDDLVLQNWRPVAFDAVFRTPPDDDSRHRISQRAVDNLTTLGGGVGGALSQSFLRMFDDFSYDALGLQCRLEDGVCQMGGIAPAPQGYYIVKGGGLPRIDVIGHQRRVDWDVLVERLQAVTATEGPVVR